MTEILDCRGLHCPEPLVRTKNALQVIPAGGKLTVLIDNPVSRENVSRYAHAQGCRVHETQQGESTVMEIVKASREAVDEPHDQKTLAVTAYINSDSIGKGPDELGKILMRAFIKTIPEVEPAIGKVIFLNQGVHLTVEGSPLLETLQDLECRGIEIHSCGTCLDFFGLLKQVRVGKVSNMYDIMTILARSERVLTP